MVDKTEYKTIKVIAQQLGVKPHTIRFWETKFPYLNPKKMGGGICYYNSKDIEYLVRINYFLKQKGYTIKGVLKIIKEEGLEKFRSGESNAEKEIVTSENKNNTISSENINNSVDIKELKVILEKLKVIQSKIT